MDEQTEREHLIRSIYRDTTLSAQEKSKKVFDILNPKIPSAQTNNENNREPEIPECEHYQRQCVIQCPAKECQRWFSCRVCHDEQIHDHQLDRKKIYNIKCLQCQTEQAPAGSCGNCLIEFSEEYCNHCHLWTVGPIFHCEQCGICRKGAASEYQHCETCGTCMINDHQCRQEVLSGSCPVCKEELFHSIRNLTQLDCGHMIHHECLLDYLKTEYRCPICHQTLGDLSETWQNLATLIQLEVMPPPYDRWQTRIACNDCSTTSVVPFHYQFHQCPDCQSFNTQKLGSIEPSD